MKKIFIFFLFLNFSFSQNLFSQENTIFGFSVEFPSSKFVILKEQNEISIKEFFVKNGYDKYSERKKLVRLNDKGEPTTKPKKTDKEMLEESYKAQKDDLGKKNKELIFYMGNNAEVGSPLEMITIFYIEGLSSLDEFKDRDVLTFYCFNFRNENEKLNFCEFENLKNKTKTFDFIKIKYSVVNHLSKKFERISYHFIHKNGVVLLETQCSVSCKKIEEGLVSIISSIK